MTATREDIVCELRGADAGGAGSAESVLSCVGVECDSAADGGGGWPAADGVEARRGRRMRELMGEARWGRCCSFLRCGCGRRSWRRWLRGLCCDCRCRKHAEAELRVGGLALGACASGEDWVSIAGRSWSH